MTITKIEETEKNIFITYEYLIRFDRKKKLWTCSCKAYVFNKLCHHIKEAVDYLGMKTQENTKEAEQNA